jgi:ABC-type bacteriocin/lantibiotic exporter with double-glycine peptidase domain
MNSDLEVRNRRPSQETIFSLTTGISTSVLNVVGSLVTIFADISLAFILVVTVTVINPLTGLLTVLIFGGLSIFLFFKMRRKMTQLGFLEIDEAVKSHSTILGSLNLFHEVHVRNLESKFTQRVFSERIKLAEISAEKLFLPNVSKYVFESALLVGTILISAAQFITQDAPRAIAVMAVFLIAGSRIAPAMLRTQQASIVIKSSLAGLHPLTNLISDLQLGNAESRDTGKEKYRAYNPEFKNSFAFDQVSFQFQSDGRKILSDLTFSSEGPRSIAIVGNSGAGKTTFVDLLLGLRRPTSGKIQVSGLEPNLAIETWPGKIGYVPQETTILNSTISQNITLDFDSEKFDSENMEYALRSANLAEWIDGLPNGINSLLTENGSNLSGGQRQRIGIARALYTRPELIILDEATSSLDPLSESEITSAILKISNQACVIIIAHRLSSVRSVDEVIYLRDGKIAARGKFDDLRRDFEDFDKQAQAMGL